MNCNEFQHELARAVESHGPTANEMAAFARHLESCQSEACREQWDHAELLTGAIGRWREAVPTVDLTDRVMARLCGPDEREQAAGSPLRTRYALVRDPSVSSDSRPAASGSRAWTAIATVAAMLLVVFSTMTLTSPDGRDLAMRDQPAQQVAGSNDGASSAYAPLPHQGRVLADTYASMPLNATRFLTDTVVLMVPADLADSDEPPSRANEWTERLGEQWEPIGRGLSSAWEVLIDVVPESSSAS